MRRSSTRPVRPLLLVRLLALWAVAVALALAAPAGAQTYPDRPIRVIIGFAAGSASDVVPRIVLDKAAALLGPNASFIFENIPGASGGPALAMVAKAEPDGYRIAGTAIAPLVINKYVFKSLGYDPETDLEPITNLTFNSNVVAVSAKLPVKTLRELVDYARANPDKLTYSSVGPGSTQHLGGVQFEQITGAKMRHLPYRVTGQLVTDLVTGEVPLTFNSIVNVVEQYRAGNVRLLAIGANERHPTIPDVPTSAEAGLPEFLSSSWFAVAGPKGMPKPIVDKLNQAIVGALKDPTVIKRLVDLGATPSPMTPEQFREFLASEHKAWREVIAKAGLQPT